MKASLGPDCPGPDCQGPICLDLFLLGFGGPGGGFGGPGGGFRTGRSSGKPLLLPVLKKPPPGDRVLIDRVLVDRVLVLTVLVLTVLVLLLLLLVFGPNCQALDMPRCQYDVVFHEESDFQVKNDEIGQLDQKN